MRPADTWVDYELIDATNHNRLERWGKTLLIRPDPQIIWKIIAKCSCLSLDLCIYFISTHIIQSKLRKRLTL